MDKNKKNSRVEFTPQELSDLYSQIQNKSNEEIENLINSDPGDIQDVDMGFIKFPWNRNGKNREPSQKLSDICQEYARYLSSEIKTIIKNNPQKTNFTLNIIQLLAPAIAQQYSGITAMALIGSITLLCRQGIENYINS